MDQRKMLNEIPTTNHDQMNTFDISTKKSEIIDTLYPRKQQQDMERIFDQYKEGKITETEILNTNNIKIISKYAKTYRDQNAINKVRELVEYSRELGEQIVQDFLNAFKECEKQNIAYIHFENTENGKLACSLLEEMPEPFKTIAQKQLKQYKEELKNRTEVLQKHTNNPEKIWKEIIGFDYYNIPEFKERFKNFLFKDIKALPKTYYKDKKIEIKQDPFALNFFIGDQENLNKVRNKSDRIVQGISTKRNGININVIKVEELEHKTRTSTSREEIHEKEHAIHRATTPFDALLFDDNSLNRDSDFLGNIYYLNSNLKWDYEKRLQKARDEIFAFIKNGEDIEYVKYFLHDKEEASPYDYADIIRKVNNEEINKNTILSDIEKEKLKEGITFLQSEYDRVLTNMIDIIYHSDKSVEFLRNVPIKELWKYSDGNYTRQDFIIRNFTP